MRSHQRSVSPFRAIEVAGGIELSVTEAEKPSVTVTAEEAVLPSIDTTVRDGVLVVAVKGVNVRSRRPMRVAVASPTLAGVRASSGARADVDKGRGPQFSARASSGSTISVRQIDAREVELAADSGSRIEARGKGNKLSLTISSGSRIDASELKVADVRVDASAGASGDVYASGLVDGSMSAGAHLRIAGGARQQVEVSAGASVTSR